MAMEIKKRKDRQKGFSLLELVLAVAVFSVGAVSLAMLLIDSSLGSRFNLERTNALLYAKEGIEAVRSIRDSVAWSSLAADTYGLSNDGMAWSLSGTPDILDGKYTRTVIIADDPVSTSTKDVSVSISWDLTPSRQVTTTLETILTDWKNR